MMLSNPENKYRFFKLLNLQDRQWPDQIQRHPPLWCSVDMRDGNQALIEPMNPERKRRFFNLLVHAGFKHIEVGFPAASTIDYNYIRELIDGDIIPKDVTIQVMTQARNSLIETTFKALKGAPRAIVHLYNATAPFFRNVVFNVDRKGCIKIATDATREIKALMNKHPETQWTFQYSPETFCFTEPEFGLQICNAVIEEFQPTDENKMILNLPTTVEISTPNVFADHIEWFCRHVNHRDQIIISVHPHNDRGTAVATAELACLAGAQRVEGTLFGNGERTGNVDIVNLALNLYSSGVDPKLNFSDINTVARTVTYCNQLPIHPRHPYVGELVFTAFSGSHQDAIKKGFAARKTNPGGLWEVPYLPVDPADLGRNYEAIIRVNSQSGKGGISYLLEQYGIILPRSLQIEFSQVVQRETEAEGKEISGDSILDCFNREFFFTPTPYKFISFEKIEQDNEFEIIANLMTPRRLQTIHGSGNNALSAFVDGCSKQGLHFTVINSHRHIYNHKDISQIYIYIEIGINGRTIFGAGRHSDELIASMKALICAVNRAVHQKFI